MPEAKPPHPPHSSVVEPYPLLFEPVVMEKVWGGRRLAALGKRLAKPDAKYGESWELADMGATSASGAGGGAVRSVIANGALKGKTIGDAIGLWGDALIHRAALAPAGDRRGTQPPPPPPDQPHQPHPESGGTQFPLLIKFLDASENLSVQVHPSQEYARMHADAHLKAECWYILAAEPGAVIYKGIRPGVTREEFARLARSGDKRIVDAMIATPAVVGECHNLPSGTVHALGAGVLAAEVQTPSDTTYRLYDWGRAGREMHVEAALECSSFEPPPAATVFRRDLEAGGAMETEFFRLMQHRIGERGLALAAKRGEVFMVLEGQGAIEGAGETIPLRAGQTGLIPAGMGQGRLVGDRRRAMVVLFARPKSA